MNKAQFIEIAQKHLDQQRGYAAGSTTKKEAGEILDAVASAIQEGLAIDGEVHLPSVGKFVVKERAARTGRNPATGDPVKIPAHLAVGFKPSKQLKDTLTT